jgi:hypothetical protein
VKTKLIIPLVSVIRMDSPGVESPRSAFSLDAPLARELNEYVMTLMRMQDKVNLMIDELRI